MPSVAGKLGPLLLVLAGLSVLGLAPPVRADNDPLVLKGLEFLRGRAGASQVGETALIALAMLKAEVPPTDPALAACLSKLRARINSTGYSPEQTGGHDVYEAGVAALALGNVPGDSRRNELEAIAAYLLGKQKANGSWDYDGRQNGDTSISQYAVLGLWEAENGGARVPPEVWERAATWFMSVQSAAGSWNYHRDEPSGHETLSMTAAGVGSLLICQRQLDRYRLKGGSASPLLVPLTPEGSRARFDVSLSNAKFDQAIKRGLGWLSANFTVGNNETVGPSPFYGLYGIERTGALADRATLGRVNWFEQGRQYIRNSQRADGAWTASFGEVPNTAWAILFVTKATAKTLARIDVKALGAGTLLGGRGLPKDLSSLTVAGGRVVSRPMNGAVEGMLAAMEDPRVKQADSALSGLVTRYRAEGPGVLRPLKDRFRKMLKDRDPGLRRVAAWSLARTEDMDTVPSLIEALTDADESVVVVAREGLQLLSRKITGLGPPSPSTPEQRREAADRWRAWYETVRPLGVEGQDEDAPPPAAARGPR
jgi:hypothetical protein